MKPSTVTPRRLPSKKHLRKILSYDPKTGVFIRKPRPGMKGYLRGKPTGSLTQNGYLSISIKSVAFLAHRLAWKIMTDEDPKYIDHVNRVRHDNRFKNLRSVSRAVNTHNRACVRGHDLPRGVYRHTLRKTKVFMAIISGGGKKTHLGCFETAKEAGAAFTREAKRIYGKNYSLEHEPKNN